MVDVNINRFGAADYVLFATMLILSSLIGFYHRFTGGRQRTAGEFLLGNRHMGTLPIAFSLFASFQSAVNLLSVPAEIYNSGTQYSVLVIAFVLSVPITCYLYLPVFYDLNVTSVNQYLEKRFNKTLRFCGAIVFMLQMITYLAVVIYAPSLALSQVTGINIWLSVFSIIIICSFYTIIGGIKAVMWTDVLQSFLMFIGMLSVCILGLLAVGGFEKVWNTAVAGERIEILNSSWSPYTRHTIWTQSIGGTFMWSAVYAVNQTQVQRCLSAKSLTHARRALWWNILGLLCNLLVPVVLGLVMYTYFKDCDPVLSNKIETHDQLLPLFAMIMFKDLPGLPGLFVAGILSGALSTLSSGLNALAAITLEDFIKSFPLWKNISEERAAVVAKWLAFFYGVVCLMNVFLVKNFSSLLTAALSLFGLLGGPVMGLFTLGMFFPWANSWGAGIGVLLGTILSLWIGIGSIMYNPPVIPLPLSTSECLSKNITNWITPILTASVHLSSNVQQPSTFSFMYNVSYMWYSMIACITVIIFGITISIMTGANNPSEIDPMLLSPIVRKLLGCCCRRKITKYKVTEPERQKSEYLKQLYKNHSQETTGF